MDGGRRQCPRNLREYAGPIVHFGLAEQAHCRIPRRIRAIAKPTPFCVIFQGHPDRAPKRAGQMRDRSVAGNDEIEVRRDRSRIYKSIGPGVEIVAQSFDFEMARESFELLGSEAFLQRN